MKSPVSVLYDAAGVAVGTLANPLYANPTGPLANLADVTGTIAGLGAAVVAPVLGYNGCSIVLTGTWTATLVFEVSADGGTTWTTSSFALVTGTNTIPIPQILASIAGVGTGGNGTYQGMGTPTCTHVRVRSTAYSAGPVNVRIVLSPVPPQLMFTQSGIMQTVIASTQNSTTANLLPAASFTGTSESTLGVAGIQVNVMVSQPIMLQMQQSMNGTDWDINAEQIILAGSGDGRTFQATASYFRLIATNLGGIATTYCRIQTALCPTVEVVPPSLTPNANLRLASMTDSWAPSPKNYQDYTLHRALLMDTDRNLNTRSRCLTDEASFRDDFTAGITYVDLTGTCYFTNGSTYVTGIGTLFRSQASTWNYVKISAHADSAYAKISEIRSDTFLILDTAYTGATTGGTGRTSFWKYNIETGTTITQVGSEMLLASGTTSGSNCQAIRSGDYLPFSISFSARITQRIANQESHVGLSDGNIGSMQNQCLMVFDGTDNTKVKFRTSFSSVDVQETLVTLPNGAVSTSSLLYQIDLDMNRAVLFISGVKSAEHQLHLPGPYSPMDCHICIKNTGVPLSTTTFAIDTYTFANFDRVEIKNSMIGDAVPVKQLRASSATFTNVPGAAADTVLLASNPLRLGATIQNDSSAILYFKYGLAASLTSYSGRLLANGYLEVPFNYNGPINGIWASATGTARVTEMQ